MEHNLVVKWNFDLEGVIPELCIWWTGRNSWLTSEVQTFRHPPFLSLEPCHTQIPSLAVLLYRLKAPSGNGKYP